jgi:hypothetical protein
MGGGNRAGKKPVFFVFGIAYTFKVIVKRFYAWSRHRGSLTHYRAIVGTDGFAVRIEAGGPLIPKISIVMRFPILQQGHFLSKVPRGLSARTILVWSCNSWSFPRFHALLRMPKCLILTNRWGRIWRANRLTNSSLLKVMDFCKPSLV